MIVAVTLHLLVAFGALGCKACGQRFCRHDKVRIAFVGALLVAEAFASVYAIDRVGLH